jgi:16S rRNA (uracil1498-N3)-methyltransferase
MTTPFFYIESLSFSDSHIELDEETSHHVSHVLRMKEGEKLKLTDGKGNSVNAIISSVSKKHTSVTITSTHSEPRENSSLTIAISLVKNASRFEWFLEKATELGVSEIIPLICDRTERQKFRADRMLGIVKSAMLQSMQTYLPDLHEPLTFNDVVEKCMHQQKMIAHCAVDAKVDFSSLYNPSLRSHIVLIGPEGDFTEKEILKAKSFSFIPVSLGSTRLRTETAGIFAAAWANGVRECD